MPIPTPSAKVLPFKRAAGSMPRSKAVTVTDGLDGPQSLRKWDRRTVATLVLLTALLGGTMIGVSKLAQHSARTPTAAVTRPAAP